MTKSKYYLLDRRADQITAVTQHIPDDQLLATKQLAGLLGVSEQLIELMRAKGEGPEWIRLGPRAIRYQMGHIRGWLATRMKLHLRTLAERQKMAGPMHPKKRTTNKSAGEAA
jgi:predicted DNA-binding transcriptional regulator AlpA